MSAGWQVYLWFWRREALRIGVLGTAIGLFMALILAISNEVQPAEIQQLFEQLPYQLRALAGLAKDVAFTQDRWVALAHGHPLWLVLALYFPVAAGHRWLAGGIQDGSLEMLLAQPIARSTWYLTLALHLLSVCFVLCLLSFLGALVASQLLPDPVAPLLLLRMAVLGFALLAAASGMSLLLSAALAGRSAGWLVGFLVLSFLIRFLADVWPSVAAMRALSLFHFHDPQRAVAEGGTWLRAGVLFGWAGLSLGAGLLFFRRREIVF